MNNDTSPSLASSVWTRILAIAAVMTVALAGCGGPNLVDRIQSPRWGLCGTVIIILDIVALVDLIGDRSRSTANKVLWSLAIIFMPILGVILYFVTKD